MWQTVQTILERRQLLLHGVCAFADVANALLPCRAAARLPANAARVLVMLFPYRFTDSGARNLSRYACVPDYHIAAGDWLRETAQELAAALPDWKFEPFIDNSPIPEVKAAALAGLGCIGDNGLLLHPQYGSWVFIGTIVTDAPLPCSSAALRYCPHCGRCAAACPGGCLPQGDRSTCLSAVSQRKGTLTPEEQARLRRNGLAWGCDTCQEVCPLNADTLCTPHPCFSAYRPLLTKADTAELSGKAYGWRGAAVPLRNLQILDEDS